MQPNQLPYFLQVIQALGPTIVAIVVGSFAAYIGWRQWRTGHVRLKLDLFNERFATFEVLAEINRAWSASKNDQWVAEYLEHMSAATIRLRKFKLLFPTRIASTFDELVNAWHDFVAEKAEEEGLDRSSSAWPDHVKKMRRLWDAIEAKNKAIRAEVEEFIRVDWEG